MCRSMLVVPATLFIAQLQPSRRCPVSPDEAAIGDIPPAFRPFILNHQRLHSNGRVIQVYILQPGDR